MHETASFSGATQAGNLGSRGIRAPDIMSDEKKPFTVKDHRQFSADGSTRAEAPAHDPLDAEAPTPAASDAEAPSDEGPEPPVDFVSFLLSLGAQAGMLLEGEKPDLRGARSLIAILEMLRDKTEGRRTPDEERVLEGLLYELRMGYLARTGAVSA